MFNKPVRSVDRVFVHCSASDNPAHDNIAQIHQWHVVENKWKDIGYHYFIRRNGTLENGRPLEDTPAAQKGNNRATIAICLHGLDEAKFSNAQFDKLRALALEINNAYGGAVTFHGHREVAAKACPVFDYRTVLKLDPFGRLGLAGATQIDLEDETGRNPKTMPVLRQGSRGPSVALAQKLLMVKDDGIFGPRTGDAVRAFQEANGLGRDGVIGEDARALQEARPALEAAGIAMPARLVYAAPFAEFSEDPVTVAIGWRPQWGLGAWAHKFDLTLLQFPLPGPDCGYELQGFALLMDETEIYRDAALPSSRHCVLGYTLERVWIADLNWPGMAAVALIGVHRVGFEGLDMRHIAVPIPFDPETAMD